LIQAEFAMALSVIFCIVSLLSKRKNRNAVSNHSFGDYN